MKVGWGWEEKRGLGTLLQEARSHCSGVVPATSCSTFSLGKMTTQGKKD